MPFIPHILWTDALVFLLVITIAVFAWYVSRHEHLLLPWRKVARSATGMCAAVVLCVFIAIGLLDSLHFRLRLDTQPAGGKTAYAAEVLSVRPEMIEIAADVSKLPEGLSARLPVKVLNRIFLGEHTEYRVAHDTLGEFMVLSPRQAERETGTYDIGDTIAAGWRTDQALVIPNE